MSNNGRENYTEDGYDRYTEWKRVLQENEKKVERKAFVRQFVVCNLNITYETGGTYARSHRRYEGAGECIMAANSVFDAIEEACG